MRVTFEEVSISATHRWVEGGKKKQRTIRFWQTISPWNKNADGSQKSRDEIMRELVVERDEWLASFKEAAHE